MMHYGYEIENELFWKGIKNGWEKESMKLWMQLCLESTTIFDIGANTGIYSLSAKTVNPNATVYAFEPVLRVYKKLVSNCLLNNYDINCFQQALSNDNGKATIYDLPTEHTLSVTVNKDLTPENTKSIPTEVNIVKLSSFIEEHRITEIDLMKIDVETHEVEVLEGFEGFLKAFQPTFLIEILNDEIAQSIQNILSNYSYLYFNIDEKKGISKVKKLTKSHYYNFLICKENVANKLKLI
ncbi:MAG: FkbM family methyltransferase [Cyclobacteriaceae bacterium]